MHARSSTRHITLQLRLQHRRRSSTSPLVLACSRDGNHGHRHMLMLRWLHGHPLLLMRLYRSLRRRYPGVVLEGDHQATALWRARRQLVSRRHWASKTTSGEPPPAMRATQLASSIWMCRSRRRLARALQSRQRMGRSRRILVACPHRLGHSAALTMPLCGGCAWAQSRPCQCSGRQRLQDRAVNAECLAHHRHLCRRQRRRRRHRLTPSHRWRRSCGARATRLWSARLRRRRRSSPCHQP